MSTSCGHDHSPRRDLRSIANDFGNAILNWLTKMGEKSPYADAARDYQRLNAMSDEELAAKNLKRDQLMDRCFGGRLYL